MQIIVSASEMAQHNKNHNVTVKYAYREVA